LKNICFRGKRKGERKNMTVKSYKDLVVWQKSMNLVKEIYSLTTKYPKDELYGLKSQMEPAVVSVPSQIADGYWRSHKKEYIQFLSIALGSAAELETQILVCKSLQKFAHLDFSEAESLLSEVMKMLYVMIERMNS